MKYNAAVEHRKYRSGNKIIRTAFTCGRKEGKNETKNPYT